MMAATAKATASTGPSPTAIRRLSRDLQKMQDEPIDGIHATPLEENILEWHYVIVGSKATPYEGGLYHGKLVFPPEFPWKPPSIYMFTPNGRFVPNTRLCLSISDYHPETWNPGWTVSAILVGLHSFMNEGSIATGTETASEERRKELASKSAAYNLRDATFCKLFPAVVSEIRGRGVEPLSEEAATACTTRSYARPAGGAAFYDFYMGPLVGGGGGPIAVPPPAQPGAAAAAGPVAAAPAPDAAAHALGAAAPVDRAAAAADRAAQRLAHARQHIAAMRQGMEDWAARRGVGAGAGAAGPMELDAMRHVVPPPRRAAQQLVQQLRLRPLAAQPPILLGMYGGAGGPPAAYEPPPLMPDDLFFAQAADVVGDALFGGGAGAAGAVGGAPAAGAAGAAGGAAAAAMHVDIARYVEEALAAGGRDQEQDGLMDMLHELQPQPADDAAAAAAAAEPLQPQTPAAGRRADEDADADGGPPPAKRTPEVVTLD